MRITPKKITRLAKVFSYVLAAWHTERQMKAIVKKNKEEGPNSLICHSHDYCDANQAMIDAFETVYGRNLDFTKEDDMTMIDAAWTVAKANDFYITSYYN